MRTNIRRRGFSKLELMASATLLGTMFAVASPLFSRLNQVWHTTRLYQLASQELMNQMDTLTRLYPEQCQSALQTLSLASEIAEVMTDAKLTGKLEPSEDCDRIVLSIHLPATVRTEPIVLVGWLQQGATP